MRLTNKLNGLVITLVLTASALCISACAPEQTQRQYTQPQTEFGPLQEDPDLGLDGVRGMAQADPSILRWSGEIDSASYFRAAQALHDLGQITQRANLARLGSKLEDAFYKSAGTTTVFELTDGPYIAAAAGETRSIVLKTAQEADSMLVDQNSLMAGILTQTGARYPWPKGAVKPDYLIDSARIYLEVMMDEVERRPVDPRVKSALRSALKNEAYPLLAKVKSEAAVILLEKNPIIMITRLRQTLDRNGISLDKATLNRLSRVERVLREAENMESAQDALSVIVGLWELSDPASRESTFKPISTDLYEYLSGKSQAGLNCLKSADCDDLGIILAKKLKILPSIREYGVGKMREQIASATRNAILSEVQAQGTTMLPRLPSLIASRVAAEIGTLRGVIKQINTDYSGFLKRLAQRFSDSKLVSPDGMELRGATARRVEVDLRDSKNLNVHAVSSRTVETGAEALGAALALAGTRLKSESDQADSPSARRRIVEQINKLLAIGGFKDDRGSQFASLARPIEPSAAAKYLDLRNFLSSTESFAVPDRFTLTEGFRAESRMQMDVSARSQAELLRGLSAMVSFFRDWEDGLFDRTLGGVEVEEFLPELPKGSVSQKLFPKDLIFSVSVGNAAVILQNMTRKLSPVFLINLDRRAIWANEFDINQGNPATMAALVDISSGKRQDAVRSSDVARYLIALTDFLKAIDGIEKTKAGPLIERGTDGKRPVDVLLDSRGQLRLLVVGLANFLSHQMQDADGGIRPLFDRVTGETKSNAPRKLIDQALSIQALLRAGDLLDMNIYRWSALDAYAYMNKTLFSRALGFYREGETVDRDDEVPNLETVVATLLAGEKLKPLMSDKSRVQWDKIASNWTSALERF